MKQTPDKLDRGLDEARAHFQAVLEEIQKAIVGHEEMVRDCLVAIFCQGHVLLEGVPGLGKTYFVRVLSEVMELSYGRVQCTPDLMPADVLGTHIVNEDPSGRRMFSFEPGPVFRNLLLVDEINRATPKTQSALLEAMQEQAVTAGRERHILPLPFFLLATQNPMEMEGTYPLPEAQLDRFFFKLNVPYPSLDELMEISNRTTRFSLPALRKVINGEQLLSIQENLSHVPVAEPLVRFAASVVLGSHPDQAFSPDSVKRYVSYGASPRGLQAIVRGSRVHCLLDGRTAVSLADMQAVIKPALRHRIILNFEGEAEAIKVDHLIDQILQTVPPPEHVSRNHSA